MSTRPGLENMGVTINAPFLGAWPTKIGSFILNFGGIELISYQQLKLLELSHEDYVKNLDRLLGKRIDRIASLLPTAKKLTPEERDVALDAWDKAR